MILKAYQIYFDEKSKANCFPQWQHYDNSEKLTAFFENTVMVDLINQEAHKESDYFAVFSHDIGREVVFSEWITPDRKYRFNPESLQLCLERYGIDFYSFEKRRQNDNIIFQAERYHPGFVQIVETILKETGFMDHVPTKLPKIVLHNHFVCRSEIYEQYVKELLIPAMEVMESIPECMNDAKYIRQLPETTKKRFIKAFGKDYYPYHPFICERLPSVFLERYKYSFKHIF